MRIQSLMLSTILLCSCTTIGTKFDIARVDQLHAGSSTERDAIQLLGAPVSTTNMANGNVLLQWQYSQGTVVGGNGAHAAILFDQSGKMLRVVQRTVIH